MKLQAIPPVDGSFRPRVDVMTEEQQPQQSKFRSRWLNAEGIPTCPACGCHEFRVRDSEPWKHGVKERYRVCNKCGLPTPKTAEAFEE